MRTAWMKFAACTGIDPERFFPFNPNGRHGRHLRESTEPAIAVCRQCPVRVECLDYALDNRIVHGVWGGYSESQRAELSRRAHR